jgi:hypothetical protein
VDPDREQIACVVDINPAKQGAYLGGTGHPIIAPDELGMHGIHYAILLNPNYFDEAQQLLTKERLAITLVNLGAA